MGEQMNPHWTSIYIPHKIMSRFEYNGPWWVSGETMSRSDDEDDFAHIICAWVMATDENAAYDTLRASFDPGTDVSEIEERFSNEKPMPDRSNPSGRFEFDDWMQWPWPVKAREDEPD